MDDISRIRSNGGRADLELIADLVTPGARVLDIGCGDGQLLERLEARHDVDARGIELSQKRVNECVARGLSVVQGNADHDLIDYPDDAFDYVILSQTLQATHSPKTVLEHLLRIGRHAVVSLPNFGHWRIRMQLMLRGRMPITDNLPDSWYETPNIHFCTIRDFVELSREIGADFELSVALNTDGQRISLNAPWWFWNLFGEQAVFLLKRRA